MYIPRAIAATLVAIAESPDDPFCVIALETLCCLGTDSTHAGQRALVATHARAVVVNPHVVAYSNGMRILFKAAVDPAHARLQDSLLRTLIYLLNEPSCRPYVRMSSEIRVRRALPLFVDSVTHPDHCGAAASHVLQYLLAPLTDTDPEIPEKEKAKVHQWRASRAAVVVLLKNWTGLISLAADPLGLRSLVETLRVSPYPEIKVPLLPLPSMQGTRHREG